MIINTVTVKSSANDYIYTVTVIESIEAFVWRCVTYPHKKIKEVKYV